MRRLDLVQRVVVGVLVVAAAVFGFTVLPDGSEPPARVDTSKARGSGSGTVAQRDLPVQARQTISRIRAGGPFPYPRDGIVFENRERRLPVEPRGFYHEYTVPTPGSSDRGARRIVNGADGFLYYSPDHYRTFRQVVPSRR